jgi:hypothetical protein
LKSSILTTNQNVLSGLCPRGSPMSIILEIGLFLYILFHVE